MNPSFFLMMLKFYIDIFSMLIYICMYVSWKQGKIVRHIRLVRAAVIGKTHREKSSSKQVRHFSSRKSSKAFMSELGRGILILE